MTRSSCWPERWKRRAPTTDIKAITAKLKDIRYDGVRTMRFDKDGRAQSDIDIGMLKGGKVTSVRASAM
jgi:hypothetical protein